MYIFLASSGSDMTGSSVYEADTATIVNADYDDVRLASGANVTPLSL